MSIRAKNISKKEKTVIPMDEFKLPHDHGGNDPTYVRKELSATHRFFATAEVFKQLGDPTRLKIFWLLCHQEQCVINIAVLMDMSSPAVSHHLRLLHDNGLIENWRDGKEVYYRAVKNQQGELLHKAVEQVMQIACPECTPDVGGSPKNQVQAVHSYLVEHLSERITIADLSRRFLMNPTTLKRVFKEVYGTSLAAHINRHRMEQAARLLKTTDGSIAQIARAVGYESQSRFTAAFTQYYNVLPRDYRRMTDKAERSSASYQEADDL